MKDCPKVLAIQNHRNKIKKNIWDILLTAVILIRFLPRGYTQRVQGLEIGDPGPCLFGFGYKRQVRGFFAQQGRPCRVGSDLIGAHYNGVRLPEI
jgi:hypothetical protein